MSTARDSLIHQNQNTPHQQSILGPAIVLIGCGIDIAMIVEGAKGESNLDTIALMIGIVLFSAHFVTASYSALKQNHCNASMCLTALSICTLMTLSVLAHTMYAPPNPANNTTAWDAGFFAPDTNDTVAGDHNYLRLQ